MSMKLTKYGHACFIVEDQDKKIIIDPGEYTALPDDLADIIAIVITHEHPDHFCPRHIDAIQQVNPGLQIFSTEAVASQIAGAVVPAVAAAYSAGSFRLVFYGNLHETARPSKPQVKNIGVCINDAIAYPGDSYTQYGKRLKAVLAPASGPWLQIAPAYAFVANAQADIIIPTHDALLSEIGQKSYDAHLREAANEAGSAYRRLAVGESIDITS